MHLEQPVCNESGVIERDTLFTQCTTLWSKTLYNIPSTVFTVYSVYSKYAMYTLQFTLYTVLYTLYIEQYTLYTEK